MKNFKVIVSLVALIAVGTASAAQKGKKLSPTEIRLLKMALAEQGRIVEDTSKGKAVTPAIAKNYENQENTIKKYQKEEYPESMKFVQEKRNELEKSVKNLNSSLAEIKRVMVPKVSIKGAPAPLTAAPQLILEEKYPAKLSVEQVQKMLPKTTKFPMTAGLSSLSSDWNDFIKVSIENSPVFYKNNKITQKWFDLAATKAKEIIPTIGNNEIKEELKNGAVELLKAFSKRTLTKEDLANIDTSIDHTIRTDEPHAPQSKTRTSPISQKEFEAAWDQPAKTPPISPEELKAALETPSLKSIPETNMPLSSTTQSKSENQKALPVVSDKPVETTSEAAMVQQLIEDNAMGLLHQSETLDKFFAITTKNPIVFYKNDQMQQNWFDLAVKKIFEIEKNKANNNSVTNYLRGQAKILYAKEIGKKVNDLQQDDLILIDSFIKKAFLNL